MKNIIMIIISIIVLFFAYGVVEKILTFSDSTIVAKDPSDV